MIEYTVKAWGNRTEWYLNGKLHREDGPAIEYANGTTHWYQNGKLHRADGPAFERADGYKEWYKNDKRHREDGPATECPSGTKYWYIEGANLTEEEFLQKQKPCSGKKITIDGIEYELV